ncbi:MAG: TolC family outer membrane protein [Alphaproteobacteria bacterium]
MAATTGSSAKSETLEEALVGAYAGNPTLLAERAALRATDEEVPQALSGWRPTVTVNADAGRSRVNTQTSFFTSAQNRKPITSSLDLTQPLFRGLRTVSSVARAENLVLSDRARLAETEQQVLLDTVTAYMDVHRDGAVLDLATNNEQRLRRQLEAARDRFEVGEVTRTDVAQAEARLSNAVADRVRAEGDLIASRAAYLNAVGTLPGKLTRPEPAGGLPASEDEARAAAVKANPAILRAQYAERAAIYDVRIATGELLPEVNLVGQLGYSEDGGSRNSRTKQASIAARLTVPLYQSGAEYAAVRAARQVAAQRRIEVDENRRTVIEDVTRAWQDLQTARARITSFEDSVRANEIALEGVEQEAAVGSRTTLDVLDAEQELFTSKVDLVRAQRDEVVASFALRAAIGALTAASIGLDVEVYNPRAHYDAVRDKLWGFHGGG